MTNDTVIKVENVSKKYCRELKHTMLYGIQDISKNAIGLSSRSERLRDGEFWALNDVSFEVKRGENIGIIGANGSGKSTLLKLLNGIFMPDKGRIEISGKVGALIEVGAGFHPMLTGRENIYINGAILGMSKREIDKKFDEIVDFADIGNFIDTPVKHYSSGMYVRLGFAVAISADPDILILDEVLAVGDAAFQKKCFDRMNSFKKNGKTIILVSHALDIMKTFPSKAMLLDCGAVVYSGNPGESVLKYMQMLFPERGGAQKDGAVLGTALEGVFNNGVGTVNNQERYCLEIIPTENDEAKSFGAGGAWINWIKIFGIEQPNIFHGGEMLEIEISCSWNQDQIKNMFQSQNVDCNLLFGIAVETKNGIVLTDLATSIIGSEKADLDPLKTSTCIIGYTVELPLLTEGDYFLSPEIALGRQENLIPLKRNESLIHLYCSPKNKLIFGLMKWTFSISKKEYVVA